MVTTLSLPVNTYVSAARFFEQIDELSAAIRPMGRLADLEIYLKGAGCRRRQGKGAPSPWAYETWACSFTFIGTNSFTQI